MADGRRHFIKKLSLLVSLVWTGLTCARDSWAQCRPDDFPGSEGIVAAPSRPVESSAPDPIQVGVTEVETGFTHSWMSGSSTQNAMSNLIKLGAWCNIEVRWSTNGFVSNTAAGTTESGFGDNALTAQYRFHRETKRVPSLAVGYAVKFPSADPLAGLGSGHLDQEAILMLSKTVKKASVVINANYFGIGQGNGVYDTKTEITLAVSRPLHKRWGAVGEIYYDSHLNAANAAYGNSTWALTYTINPRLVFDGGAYVGLSHGAGAPGNSLFVGISYVIGDLYRVSNHRPHPSIAESERN